MTKKKTNFYFKELNRESTNRLKISIGKFLDRTDIIPWYDDEGKLMTIETLNQIDRQEIATLYALKVLKTSTLEGLKARDYYFSADLTWEKFMSDLVRYIDLRLPMHFWSHSHRSGKKPLSELRHSYRGIDYIQGAEFSDRVNYIMEKRYLATRDMGRQNLLLERKLKELNQLAQKQGYRLKQRYFKGKDILTLIDAFKYQTLSDEQIALFLEKDIQFSIQKEA